MNDPSIFAIMNEWAAYYAAPERVNVVNLREVLRENLVRVSRPNASHLSLEIDRENVLDLSVMRRHKLDEVNGVPSEVTVESDSVSSSTVRESTDYSSAFRQCCEYCRTGPVPPCSNLLDILSPTSCLAQKVPLKVLFKIVVLDLGIFGIGNYNRFELLAHDIYDMKVSVKENGESVVSTYKSLTSSKVMPQVTGQFNEDNDHDDPNEFGIQWCYNNCLKPEMWRILNQIKGTDAKIFAPFKGLFFNTKY